MGFTCPTVERRAAVAPKPQVVSVLVIDDCAEARDRQIQLLRAQKTVDVVTRAASRDAALAAVVALRPDVVVINDSVTNEPDLDLCREVEALGAPTRTLVLTSDNSEQSVRTALSIGVRGYLMESEAATQLGSALRDVASGLLVVSRRVAGHVRHLLQAAHAPPRFTPAAALTARETEILKYLGSGRRNQEIAAALCISKKTVETHVRQVLLKMGLRTRTQAAVHAVRAGLC